MQKPIAKSLHTVTVLVQVARSTGYPNPEDAIKRALIILGLEDAPDVYGLAAQALKKLNKGT